jgi:DNA-binding Lrp family transcriptional regulator
MKKEIEIIEKLIKNPRASYAEIAKSLNLSPETVRQYLHRILKNKTLELHCVPDNRYLGKRRCTLVLSVPMDSKVQVVEKLKKIPQTLELRSGVLNPSVIMDVVTSDVDATTNELLKLLKNLGVEVREIFESEHVYFNAGAMLE